MKSVFHTTEETFIKAYDQHADGIFRHCYFRISDRARAQDLMQETFTRTWEHIANGGTIENLKAFLYRVAHNLIVDEYRKKKSVSLDALTESGFDPAADGEHEKIVDSAEVEHMMKLLNKIDAKQREVVLMRHVEGLSPKDIAEVTGETENVISVRIHRGITALRNLMK